MIIYFADRNLHILGSASDLLNGNLLTYHKMTEDIDTGVAQLECDIAWSDGTRLGLEQMADAGNYVLAEYYNEARLFVIIDTETNTADKKVSIFCEDAGLDLINEIAPAFDSPSAHTIEWYINHFKGDSEFTIGVNEISDLTRKLTWDSASTVTERLRSVATQFDNAEISYSYEVDNFEITAKHINVWKSRGADLGRELRLDREINAFRIKKSIANLVTGLRVTGGTPENAENPITLKGYTYDDGDIYISGDKLLSRKGAERWGRLADGVSYIMGDYSFDTTSKAELCTRAVNYLKAHLEPEYNYEVELSRGLDDLRLGDRINLVDDKGEVYVSARVLQLTRCSEGDSATLGEFLMESSGISEAVMTFASQVAFKQGYSLTILSSQGSDFVDTNINTTLTASVLFNGSTLTQADLTERGMNVVWYSGTTQLGTGLTYTVTNQSTINITARLEDI